MTSVAVVAASSRTTRRSRHSISVRRGRFVLLGHGRRVRLVANVRNVAALFPTMRIRSRNRREDIRLSVARFAARAVTDKRVIANCRLVAEASGRVGRLVQ